MADSYSHNMKIDICYDTMCGPKQRTPECPYPVMTIE